MAIDHRKILSLKQLCILFHVVFLQYVQVLVQYTLFIYYTQFLLVAISNKCNSIERKRVLSGLIIAFQFEINCYNNVDTISEGEL